MHCRRFPTLAILVLPLLAACGGGGGDGGGGEVPEDPPVLKVVTNLDDAGPGSLRQTVQDALPGEWVVFDTALPTGTVNLLSPIPIQKEVVIGGLSATFERFELDAGGTHRHFVLMPGTSLDLRDLVLVDGQADRGGAIDGEEATVLLTRVQIVACHAPGGGGGAVHLYQGDLVATGCAFTACTAKWGGAVHVEYANARFDRCSFYLNTATNTAGGGLHFSGGDLHVLNSTFEGNQASNAVNGVGGAISIGTTNASDPANAWVSSCTVTGNSAGSQAGGIYVTKQDPASQLTLAQSIVATNTAPTGQDLDFENGATGSGTRNVIGIGDGDGVFFNGLGENQVGDLFTPVDPMLEAAALHFGGRVMRMPQALSPAVDAIPAGECQDTLGAPLTVDQRAEARDPALPADLGAIER